MSLGVPRISPWNNDPCFLYGSFPPTCHPEARQALCGTTWIRWCLGNSAETPNSSYPPPKFMGFLRVSLVIYGIYWMKLTAKAPKNGGWKTILSYLGFGNFSGAIVVKLRGGGISSTCELTKIGKRVKKTRSCFRWWCINCTLFVEGWKIWTKLQKSTRVWWPFWGSWLGYGWGVWRGSEIIGLGPFFHQFKDEKLTNPRNICA